MYLSFEDTVVGFDGQFTDIHVELAGDDLSYFVQQSHAVYTFYIYGDEERQILVSVPLGGDDTVSVATLKAGGNGALALVDDNTVLLVDVSQYVVTGMDGEQSAIIYVLCRWSLPSASESA